MKLRCILTLFIAALFLNTQAQWIQLGSGNDPLGTNGSYYIEAMCTDPSGNVYAGGHFMDGNGHEFVAKWNGTAWAELGTGSNALNAGDYIRSLCSDAQGNIYAGGDFRDSTGVAAYVAKWDGTHWFNLGSGQNTGATFVQSILSLCADTSGNIYAAGEITNSTGTIYVVTEFNASNSTWSQLGPNSLNANSKVEVIKSDGTTLYAAGDFTDGGIGSGNHYVAKWDGTSWTRVGTGQAALTANDNILSMCVTPNHDIYVGGAFTNGANNQYVTKWDGNSWTSAGGVNGINYSQAVGSIYALATDAQGNVYAGGGFIDGNFTEYVAKWNGSSWSNLGNLGGNNFINVIIANAGNVYAGGAFENTSSYPYVAEFANGANGIESIQAATCRVYPNPTQNLCNIAFNQPATATITLTDVTGKTLQTLQAENAINATLNFNNYAAGIYLIRLQSANQQPQTIKVVKQ